MVGLSVRDPYTPMLLSGTGHRKPIINKRMDITQLGNIIGPVVVKVGSISMIPTVAH